ncbi:hypothetical protein [Nocardia asteroides]|uniref:hypothetical protein n=1 Tax=Nocardia asteroides TaxID=1824 RepID=UPI0033DC20E3
MTRKVMKRLVLEVESKFSEIGYVVPVEGLSRDSDEGERIVLACGDVDALNLRRQIRIAVFRRSSGAHQVFGQIALVCDAVADVFDSLPDAARLHANLGFEVPGTVVETSLTDLIGVERHFAPQIFDVDDVARVVSGLVRVVSERGSTWFAEWSTFDSILSAACHRRRVSFARWNIDPVAFRAAIVLGVCNGEFQAVSRAMDWYRGRWTGMNSSDSRERARALDEHLREISVEYREFRRSLRG